MKTKISFIMISLLISILLIVSVKANNIDINLFEGFENWNVNQWSIYHGGSNWNYTINNFGYKGNHSLNIKIPSYSHSGSGGSMIIRKDYTFENNITNFKCDFWVKLSLSDGNVTINHKQNFAYFNGLNDNLAVFRYEVINGMLRFSPYAYFMGDVSYFWDKSILNDNQYHYFMIDYKISDHLTLGCDNYIFTYQMTEEDKQDSMYLEDVSWLNHVYLGFNTGSNYGQNEDLRIYYDNFFMQYELDYTLFYVFISGFVVMVASACYFAIKIRGGDFIKGMFFGIFGIAIGLIMVIIWLV